MCGLARKIDGKPRKNRIHSLDSSESPTAVNTASSLSQMGKWFYMATLNFPCCR
jgi:hypothetical protein